MLREFVDRSVRRATAALICAAVLVVGGLPAVVHAATVDADAKLIRGYSLSLDKLHRYAAAATALRAACVTDPQLAKPGSAQQAGDGKPKTMAATIRKVGTMHWYHAYFEPRGLSPADVVLLPLTLSTAAMLAKYKVDPGQDDTVSAAQVAFYKKHRAEIDKLNLNAMCPQPKP